MLKSRVSSQTKDTPLSRLFWGRQHFLRFHLIQNKRMLGLNFAHLGNGFSYLGGAARSLKRLSRTRWALAYPNQTQLIHPLTALSTTLKERLELPVVKVAYAKGALLFNVAAPANLGNHDFNSSLFVRAQSQLVPFGKSLPSAGLTEPSAQLNGFVRLAALNDLGLGLFILLSLN